MSTFFVNGAVVDWIVALVIIEAIAVIAHRIATGCGPEPIGFLFNLLAGAFLLFALRGALGGADGLEIMACLAVAFIAHSVDLLTRWANTPLHLPAHMVFRADRAPRPKRHIVQRTRA